MTEDSPGSLGSPGSAMLGTGLGGDMSALDIAQIKTHIWDN